MRLDLKSMPTEEVEAIHSTSIEILSKVGVKFPDKVALDALEGIGARIDRKAMVARFSEQTVREALKHVPKQVTLCARNPAHDVELMRGDVHFCPSGLGVFVYDPVTRQRRAATRDDVIKFALVSDALPNYHLIQVEIMPSDVPAHLADLYRFLAGLTQSSKHVSNVIAPGSTIETARSVIEMAAKVAGGTDGLRKRAIISVHQEPISPLQYDENGLSVLIEYVRHNIPVSLYSLSMGGASAPVTVAGQLVVINAEILAGIALVQAISPGCPVLYGASASVMDPTTGALAMGAPERALVTVGVVNLARYYGLPSMAAALNTEASMPGSQAVFEKMISTLPLALAEPDVIFGGGTFDSSNTYSLDQLVIDDELCGAMIRVANGFRTTKDELACNVIEKVGIGGHYLGESHSLKHIRSERWFPSLYKRMKKTETQWTLEDMGKHDLAAAAKKRVQDILKTHKPDPLSDDIQNALHAIIAGAERVT